MYSKYSCLNFCIITINLLLDLTFGASVIHERCPDNTKPPNRCSKDLDCPVGTSCFDLLYFENGICCGDLLFTGPSGTASGRDRPSLDGEKDSVIPMDLILKLKKTNFMVNINGVTKHAWKDTTKAEKELILKQHKLEQVLKNSQPQFNGVQITDSIAANLRNRYPNSEISRVEVRPVAQYRIYEGQLGLTYSTQNTPLLRPKITQNTCAYGHWSSWASCSERCGTGSRTRIKTALNGQDDYCKRVLKETSPCNTRNCTTADRMAAVYRSRAALYASPVQRSQSQYGSRTTTSRSKPSRSSKSTHNPSPYSSSMEVFGQEGSDFEQYFGTDWIKEFNKDQQKEWNTATAGFNSFSFPGADPPGYKPDDKCVDSGDESHCRSFKQAGYCNYDSGIQAQCHKTCRICR